VWRLYGDRVRCVLDILCQSASVAKQTRTQIFVEGREPAHHHLRHLLVGDCSRLATLCWRQLERLQVETRLISILAKQVSSLVPLSKSHRPAYFAGLFFLLRLYFLLLTYYLLLEFARTPAFAVCGRRFLRGGNRQSVARATPVFRRPLGWAGYRQLTKCLLARFWQLRQLFGKWLLRA
jgi:hypothetical protein